MKSKCVSLTANFMTHSLNLQHHSFIKRLGNNAKVVGANNSKLMLNSDELKGAEFTVVYIVAEKYDLIFR